MMKFDHDYHIAFLIPITTRKLESGYISDIPLWKILLPTFKKTSKSFWEREVGFDFVFGYDPDKLLTLPAHRAEFQRLWSEAMGAAQVQTGKCRLAMLELDCGFMRSAASWAVVGVGRVRCQVWCRLPVSNQRRSTDHDFGLG